MTANSMRKLLGAKIHRLTVTAADVAYEGSFTLPPELMDAAGMVPYESLHVWNVTRGTRLETYAIRGPSGKRDVCANGAAAHLVHPGDEVIVATYKMVPESEVAAHQPRLVFVDAANQMTHTGPEVPGPARRQSTPTPSVDASAPERIG